MLRPGGYLVTFGPEGAPIERDTVTCNHCQKLIIVTPGQGLGDISGFCTGCSKRICQSCEQERTRALGICKPWLKQVEEMEERQHHVATRGY